MALGQGYTLRAEAQAASAEGPLPDPGVCPGLAQGAVFLSALCLPHRLLASCSPCLPLPPTEAYGAEAAALGLLWGPLSLLDHQAQGAESPGGFPDSRQGAPPAYVGPALCWVPQDHSLGGAQDHQRGGGFSHCSSSSSPATRWAEIARGFSEPSLSAPVTGCRQVPLGL